MANVHPSKEAHEFLEHTLAKRTGIRRNVWARIAVARSLTLESPAADQSYDSEGTELARHTILGEQDALFKAMFALKYQREVSDDEFFPGLFKVHMERGARLLKQDWELSGGRPEDFYAKLAENLPQVRVETDDTVDHRGVSRLLRLEIGNVFDSNDPAFWSINCANNAHAAVVGTTGSGKTQFVKDLLAQTREQSAEQLPFIFFDYARGDVSGDDVFVQATRSEVILVPNQPVPLNPFPRCRTPLEVNQQAHHVAKIFRDVAPHIGIVQEQRLIAAVQQCYDESDGEPPDFYDLRAVVDATGEVDSLTGVLAKVTDLRLFPQRGRDQIVDVHELLAKPRIIALHRLQELRELVVFLVLDSLKNYFSRLKDQAVDQTSGARELRSILVIDEAHNFLPRDQAQVLEKCLRELRGKGVGVWLLTQNPRDLEQPHYNYATEVNFHICLKVLNAQPQTLTNLYGVPPGEARNWSVRLTTFDSEGLCRNSELARGFSRVRLRQFWQRAGRQ